MAQLRSANIWLTGASSGIGEALALELGRRGARLALSARRGEVLESLVHRIKSAGGDARAFPVDVTDIEALKTTQQAIRSELGPIDILIANAGTHIFSVPENFDSAEYLFLMDTNYGGMLRAIEAALPDMLCRGKGEIVGMASLAGFRGLPRAAAYGASKAAMIHFLESIRFHLKYNNIGVTIVNPGFVKTPLTDKNDFFMPFLTSPEKAARIICDGIERGRKEISFPIPFNWLLKLMRILPYPLYEWLISLEWHRHRKQRL